MTNRSGFNRLAIVAMSMLFIMTTLEAHAECVTVPSSRFQNIMSAITAGQPGDTVLVKPGVYKENVIVSNGVVLASEPPLSAVLDGARRTYAVTVSGRSALCGFEIRNGNFGVYSKGVGNSIEKCRIVNNSRTGVLCVGGLPKITDNIIAFNGGSGVVGYELQADVFPVIDHNTIAYNLNNGITIAKPIRIGISDNIFAYNQHYGIKVAPKDLNVAISSNCFFANGISCNNKELQPSNIFCDPLFRNPRKMDFTTSEKSKCLNRELPEKNPGARFGH